MQMNFERPEVDFIGGKNISTIVSVKFPGAGKLELVHKLRRHLKDQAVVVSTRDMQTPTGFINEGMHYYHAKALDKMVACVVNFLVEQEKSEICQVVVWNCDEEGNKVFE
eukprot:EG_transcript_54916